MSDFFDSSWLIAALVEEEPHHRLCREKLDQVLTAGSGLAAQHSLAEVFHTITGKKNVPPQQAAELLRHNFADLRWLPLAKEDYWHCVDLAHQRGARGGAIFDLLLLQAAERHNATRIYTLNKRHFVALGPHLRNRIVGPDD
jgi:predicted nucleic acid-binding protein